MSCCSSCLPTGSFCSPPKIFGRDLCMTSMKGSSDKIYIFLSIYYSTIYCATIRVLSQCTLDVLQEVYYAQNIGLSQVQHVYLSDSNSIHRCDMYIRRITGTTCVFVGLQDRHIYLSDFQ